MLPDAQPLPPASAPTIRSCRQVIGAVGDLAGSLAGDQHDTLQILERVNPALASRLRALLDSAYDLDARTGFLADHVPAHLRG